MYGAQVYVPLCSLRPSGKTLRQNCHDRIDVRLRELRQQGSLGAVCGVASNEINCRNRLIPSGWVSGFAGRVSSLASKSSRVERHTVHRRHPIRRGTESRIELGKWISRVDTFALHSIALPSC